MTVLPSTTEDMLGALAPWLRVVDDILGYTLIVIVVVEGAAALGRRISIADRADRWFQIVLVAIVALSPLRVLAHSIASGWASRETIAAALDSVVAAGCLWFLAHRAGKARRTQKDGTR